MAVFSISLYSIYMPARRKNNSSWAGQSVRWRWIDPPHPHPIPIPSPHHPEWKENDDNDLLFDIDDDNGNDSDDDDDERWIVVFKVCVCLCLYHSSKEGLNFAACFCQRDTSHICMPCLASLLFFNQIQHSKHHSMALAAHLAW